MSHVSHTTVVLLLHSWIYPIDLNTSHTGAQSQSSDAVLKPEVSQPHFGAIQGYIVLILIKVHLSWWWGGGLQAFPRGMLNEISQTLLILRLIHLVLEGVAWKWSYLAGWTLSHSKWSRFSRRIRSSKQQTIVIWWSLNRERLPQPPACTKRVN